MIGSSFLVDTRSPAVDLVATLKIARVIIGQGLPEHPVATLPSVGKLGRVEARPGPVVMGDMGYNTLLDAPEARAQGQAGDHVLILPAPAFEPAVIAPDGLEVGSLDDQQPGRLTGTVVGILLIVDDRQFAPVAK